MTHSVKFKRLAKKLGAKSDKPGSLLDRMHSLKGMPKKKHHKSHHLMMPSAPQVNRLGAVQKTSQPAPTRNLGLRMPKMKHHKNWIADAIKKPGALHAELGVKKGSKIPVKKLNSAVKKGGLEGKRASLAKTLRNLHHKSESSFKHMKMVCKVHKKMNCKVC